MPSNSSRWITPCRLGRLTSSPRSEARARVLSNPSSQFCSLLPVLPTIPWPPFPPRPSPFDRSPAARPSSSSFPYLSVYAFAPRLQKHPPHLPSSRCSGRALMVVAPISSPLPPIHNPPPSGPLAARCEHRSLEHPHKLPVCPLWLLSWARSEVSASASSSCRSLQLACAPAHVVLVLFLPRLQIYIYRYISVPYSVDINNNKRFSTWASRYPSAIHPLAAPPPSAPHPPKRTPNSRFFRVRIPTCVGGLDPTCRQARASRCDEP
ncbi:hypothetical protein LX36DRAFT_85685 [Colletotrichum falcatum]|nr:hypothetical protein LX36DRAFT_85685 [Colletotrichum falcatum]